MPKVEFHFDFGSPNAYLSHLVIPEIEQRQGVEVRVRAGAAGRRLQADRQPLAGRDQCRHQEQARVREARDRALHQAPRHHALPAQPVLPGQHADDHARRRRGAEARHLRALCRRDLPAHVGGAEEARRSGGAARGADRIGARRRAPVRRWPRTRRSRTSCSPTPSARSSAAPSARRPSSSATRSSSARTGCATSRRRSRAKK